MFLCDWGKGKKLTWYSLHLELLERVLLRLAAAETDEQLEKSVAKFLTPTLLKLASPHESVKKKVGPVPRPD